MINKQPQSQQQPQQLQLGTAGKFFLEDQKKVEETLEELNAIKAPSNHKKKGPTINQMLQNDLESEDERIARFKKIQQQEKDKMAKFEIEKQERIRLMRQREDAEELIRFGHQILPEDFKELSEQDSRMSSNQDFVKETLKNDLAMLEEYEDSYNQNNEGGFNGYNSLKRSENLNYSRPSSSPRGNDFLARTYDSLALTQQFNRNFNYGTSGGGIDDNSQYSQVDRVPDDLQHQTPNPYHEETQSEQEQQQRSIESTPVGIIEGQTDFTANNDQELIESLQDQVAQNADIEISQNQYQISEQLENKLPSKSISEQNQSDQDMEESRKYDILYQDLAEQQEVQQIQVDEISKQNIDKTHEIIDQTNLQDYQIQESDDALNYQTNHQQDQQLIETSNHSEVDDQDQTMNLDNIVPSDLYLPLTHPPTTNQSHIEDEEDDYTHQDAQLNQTSNTLIDYLENNNNNNNNNQTNDNPVINDMIEQQPPNNIEDLKDNDQYPQEEESKEEQVESDQEQEEQTTIDYNITQTVQQTANQSRVSDHHEEDQRQGETQIQNDQQQQLEEEDQGEQVIHHQDQQQDAEDLPQRQQPYQEEQSIHDTQSEEQHHNYEDQQLDKDEILIEEFTPALQTVDNYNPLELDDPHPSLEIARVGQLSNANSLTSTETLQNMFDFLKGSAERREYKSMSKRNLQIEIPEDGYGEDESLADDHDQQQQQQLVDQPQTSLDTDDKQEEHVINDNHHSDGEQEDNDDEDEESIDGDEMPIEQLQEEQEAEEQQRMSERSIHEDEPDNQQEDHLEEVDQEQIQVDTEERSSISDNIIDNKQIEADHSDHEDQQVEEIEINQPEQLDHEQSQEDQQSNQSAEEQQNIEIHNQNQEEAQESSQQNDELSDNQDQIDDQNNQEIEHIQPLNEQSQDFDQQEQIADNLPSPQQEVKSDNSSPKSQSSQIQPLNEQSQDFDQQEQIADNLPSPQQEVKSDHSSPEQSSSQMLDLNNEDQEVEQLVPVEDFKSSEKSVESQPPQLKDDQSPSSMQSQIELLEVIESSPKPESIRSYHSSRKISVESEKQVESLLDKTDDLQEFPEQDNEIMPQIQSDDKRDQASEQLNELSDHEDQQNQELQEIISNNQHSKHHSSRSHHSIAIEQQIQSKQSSPQSLMNKSYRSQREAQIVEDLINQEEEEPGPLSPQNYLQDYQSQEELERKHRELNNDMFNLLKVNQDSYQDDHSFSAQESQPTDEQQFFYRQENQSPHDRDASEDNRRQMLIIGDQDNMSSQSHCNDDDFLSQSNQQQQQQEEGGYQDDNYDNIGKWEEQNKENEINEIESLEFSVKREEFAEQQYQSQTQVEQQIQSSPQPVPTTLPINESMQLYNSPSKPQEINLFKSKRDSKSSHHQSSHPLPRPPSAQNEDKQKRTASKQQSSTKQVQEKRSIQKIKDLFNSEEKYQMYERLHSKETLSSQRKRRGFEGQTADNSASKNLTFRPKIDPHSNLLSVSHLDETKVSQRTIDPCVFLYHKGVQLREEKKRQQESKKELIESEKLKECTFRPKTAANPMISKPTLSVERAAQMYERNKHWDAMRKKKIREEQERIKDNELDECSFKPQIQPPHALGRHIQQLRQDDDIQAYESKASTIYAGRTERGSRSRNKIQIAPAQQLMTDRSVKQFLERQERAKQQKLEKNAVFQKNNGSNWKHEVTKPRPPKITDIIISNLQKKLTHNNQKIFNNTRDEQTVEHQDDPQKDAFNYASRRKSRESGALRITVGKNQMQTNTYSQEGSVLEGVDQDIMIFDDGTNLSEKPNINHKKKNTQSNAEFKDAVKFLRQALHQLDLDQ